MALCDFRRYEPTECGAFKVRVSDGDLVWECAPVINRPNIAPVQFPINVVQPSVDDKILIQGRASSHWPAVMEVTQEDGLITSVDRTETVAPTPGYIGGPTIRLPMDHNESYAFGTAYGGYLHSTNETSFVFKFDRSTHEHTGTLAFGQALSFGSPAWAYYMWACRAYGEYVDVWNWGGSYTQNRINRIPVGDFWDPSDPLPAPINTVAGYMNSLTNVTCTPLMDRYNRIPSDGTYYYMTQSNANVTGPLLYTAAKIKKIEIAGLTMVADSAVEIPTWFTEAEVRDGFIILTYGSFANFRMTVFDTATLTQQYNVLLSPSSRRCISMDIVAEFSATLEVATTSTTTLDIVCRDTAGTELWSVPIAAIQSPTALLRQYQPKVLISQDKSKVYVWGPLKRGTQSVQLYCLDATNGDTLWSFAAVGMLQTLFTSSGSGGAGMMLHDDGDHVYLSVVSCFAPEYR